MDPQVITIICSVVAALAVAIPALVTAHNTNNLVEHRLKAVEERLEKLEEKLDSYHELREELIRTEVRVSTLEREVKLLKNS